MTSNSGKALDHSSAALLKKKNEKDDEETNPSFGGRYQKTLACSIFANAGSTTRVAHPHHELPILRWLSSFYRSDPRWQIRKYFDEVATRGRPCRRGSVGRETLFRGEAHIFTVWRPTSRDAIRNMMLGEGTGKGMDVKGKSARAGNISSFVPFVQIATAEHKEKVRGSLADDGTVRIYYKNENDRDGARENLLAARVAMLLNAKDAAKIWVKIERGEFVSEHEHDFALKHQVNNQGNLRLEMVDIFAPELYGMDVSERLFWQGFVMEQDCSRPEGTEWFINRGSSVHNMNNNLSSTRKEVSPDERRVVVYQKGDNPMEPRTLLVAYEENGTVLPVVSDFDLFLLGSRGLEYPSRISEEHLELLRWLLRNIHRLFEERRLTGERTDWSKSWPDVIRRSSIIDGYYPKTPPYGHGDPVLSNIIEHAAERLKANGCVRHGPECFNLHFPVDIDEEFLVVCDALPSNIRSTVPWKKMNVDELQELLIDMIDDGFTFPINPKWVLCDPGWKRVWDKLMASNHANVQESLNCWFPPEANIREEVQKISNEHPHGLNAGLEAMAEAASSNVTDVRVESEQARRNTLSPGEERALLNKIREKMLGTPQFDGDLPLSRPSVKVQPKQKAKDDRRSEDPRLQIQKCFDRVVQQNKGQGISEASVFTVWRGTASEAAIKQMMLGVAKGKGLEIKARSAKRGNISQYGQYVPFIPWCEDKDREMLWNSLRDNQVFRIFYCSNDSRLKAVETLLLTKTLMLHDMRLLNDKSSDTTEQELFMGNRVCNDADLKVTLVDDYAPEVYGLDISERLLWEAYVMQRDCSRPEGSEWDVGSDSHVIFTQMNINTLRRKHSLNPLVLRRGERGKEGMNVPPESPSPSPEVEEAKDRGLLGVLPHDGKPVLYQIKEKSPMEPRTLVMAYEEHGSVKPVVPDIDCFTFGTRGVNFDTIDKKHVGLMQWSVQNTEEFLHKQKSTGKDLDWTKSWLDVLEAEKKTLNNFFPIPPCGLGDPQTNRIFADVIKLLQDTGCVRHGGECFNWVFPQPIDDQFILISENLPGDTPWKFVNVEELQDFLCAKIDEGFAFPMNPKWILCDPGWKKVYDKLLTSANPNIQNSLECWFPLESGIRGDIDRIWNKYCHRLSED